MKLANLSLEVINDLCNDDNWRLDIDPGFDSKHEFWLCWRHFVSLPKDPPIYYEATEDNLADFLTFDNFSILLPVPRTHHLAICLIRLIPSIDQQTLTLLIHDSFYEDWFKDKFSTRYGFLAIADRYQKFGYDFYLASYYHFSYLINKDYELAHLIMSEKLNNQT